VIRPTTLEPREYDRLYDRLIFRMWSWNRYLRGKCGRTSLLAFLKWWIFVRLLILKLRWRRREIYRDAQRGILPTAGNFQSRPASADAP